MAGEGTMSLSSDLQKEVGGELICLILPFNNRATACHQSTGCGTVVLRPRTSFACCQLPPVLPACLPVGIIALLLDFAPTHAHTCTPTHRHATPLIQLTQSGHNIVSHASPRAPSQPIARSPALAPSERGTFLTRPSPATSTTATTATRARRQRRRRGWMSPCPRWRR